MKSRSTRLAPALALVAGLLLTACPMTTTKPPGTPNAPSDDKNCLQPALPGEQLPDLESWNGEVPPTIPGAIWVIAPLDEEGRDHLLTLIEPEKGAVLKTIAVKGENFADAMQKLTAGEVRLPLIAFSGLGSLRPVPQPGPPGEPKLWAIRFSLNAARGMFWAMRQVQLGDQGLVQQPPVTHR